MQIDFLKQDAKKKRKMTHKLPPPMHVSAKTKEKEREIQTFFNKARKASKKLSHPFPLKWLSANTLQTNQKSENLSKQEERKEISKKKGRGKEEEGRGRQTKPCNLQESSLTCA